MSSQHNTTALLTVSRAEDASRVIERLDEAEVAYFPRTSDCEPETQLRIDGQVFSGEADILAAIDLLY